MMSVIKDPVLQLVRRTTGIWQCARRTLKRSRRERYRPEQHYMRGPGPKYRAAGRDSAEGPTAGANGEMTGK